MSSKNLIRTLALLVLLAMVAAACGQKEGVHQVGFAGGGGGATAGGTALPEGETFEDVDGDGVDDTTGFSADDFEVAAGGGDLGGGGDPAAGGVTGGDPAAGGGGGGDPAAGGGGGGGGGGAEAPGDTASGGGGGGGGDTGGGGGGGDTGGGPGDSTGVTASTVKIGVHAPLTGAAPIPAESFRSGKDQYWKNNKIAGRQVEVVFRDDKYNPSTASQVCQELIVSEKVFLLTGSGGTDQIVACARVAAKFGVPYLSAGVTELTLNKLSNYFALSQSYAQQMTPLMQLINKEAKPANKKVGLIASDTANFDDAVSAFGKAAQSAGLSPVVYRPSKSPSKAELAALAQKMAADQVKVATPVMAPTQWIELATNPQVRTVKWKGVGITQGLNTVAGVVCNGTQGAINGATFFSPWPGLNLAGQLDPNFAKSGGSDDIQWGLWGLNKTLHVAFSKLGDNITREGFAKAMTSGIKSGVYPDLAHTSSDHFRVVNLHNLRLDCGSRQFKSSPQDIFRKGF